MADIAPLATYHYVMASIKDESLTPEKYGRPLIGIRQTGFEEMFSEMKPRLIQKPEKYQLVNPAA